MDQQDTTMGQEIAELIEEQDSSREVGGGGPSC